MMGLHLITGTCNGRGLSAHCFTGLVRGINGSVYKELAHEPRFKVAPPVSGGWQPRCLFVSYQWISGMRAWLWPGRNCGPLKGQLRLPPQIKLVLALYRTQSRRCAL